jgi:hypothetical protein
MIKLLSTNLNPSYKSYKPHPTLDIIPIRFKYLILFILQK